MPRGPHDQKIEEQHPGKDHARQRLDEFMQRREPDCMPEENDEEEKAKEGKKKPRDRIAKTDSKSGRRRD